MKPLILAAALCATTANADITVRFVDGAPKDRFTITNVGACDTLPLTLFIDLRGSPFGLIFDVSADGAGVEVFQPVEFVSGADFVESVSPVTDGDTGLTLGLRAIPQGADIAFTSDIDDTAGTREITVSGSELEGARVVITFEGRVTSSAFDASGTALVETGFCAP